MNGPFRSGADAAATPLKYPNMDLAKRAVKLITHQTEDAAATAARLSSPPVSSTRQSPCPDTVTADDDEDNVDDDDDQDVEVVVTTCKNGETIGPIRCRTPKQVDVWRPY